MHTGLKAMHATVTTIFHIKPLNMNAKSVCTFNWHDMT